jgi:hypothetical protein
MSRFSVSTSCCESATKTGRRKLQVGKRNCTTLAAKHLFNLTHPHGDNKVAGRARHSAPSPQPCVTRTRKRAARAVCLTHSVLRRSEVRLALAPGWRSTQHEAIAASQCASPLDSDLDATSPIASARTPRHRSRADYWMEQPRRDRLLIPSLSADPFEEVRLIHRRA